MDSDGSRRFTDKEVAIVLCGANVDTETLKRIL